MTLSFSYSFTAKVYEPFKGSLKMFYRTFDKIYEPFVETFWQNAMSLCLVDFEKQIKLLKYNEPQKKDVL